MTATIDTKPKLRARRLIRVRHGDHSYLLRLMPDGLTVRRLRSKRKPKHLTPGELIDIAHGQFPMHAIL